MTAETTDAVPRPDQGSRKVRRVVRPVVGALADGTPYYVPGRPLPEQRRRKAARAAATASSEVAAQANRDRAARHRAEVAVRVADDQGYPTLGAYVLARVASGASLAAISREAGLNKDWLHRHLAEVDPAVAVAIRKGPPGRDGPRWLQPVTA